MRKSDLESMVMNQKRQITWLERDTKDLHGRLKAMADCLNIIFVPEKTISLKYEKKK